MKDEGGALAASISEHYMGLPSGDVPTALELVAGEDGLASAGEALRVTAKVLKWDLPALTVSWAQAFLSCQLHAQ